MDAQWNVLRQGFFEDPFKNADQLLKVVDDYAALFPTVSLKHLHIENPSYSLD
jgi:hypothetical protein